MFRWLKALSFMLAIAALSIVATGCGSSNPQVRVVNAIPDASANLDIDINGANYFPNLPFAAVYPAQTYLGATYVSVPSGSDAFSAYNTGTTTNPIIAGTSTNTFNFDSSTSYTVVLAGLLNGPPQAYAIPDDNTAPTTSYVEFRVINASANTLTTGGIDVYIYQTGQPQPSSPQISGLTLGQGSSYQSIIYESSYDVLVTAHGQNATIIHQSYGQSNIPDGQITTVVIVDNPGGEGINPTPLEWTDLK